jgi:folate-binding protein YgfZ
MPQPTSYDAVCRAAGLIDRPGRALLAVTGRDRAGYLQGLLSNDILALAPGTGCYATHLTPQGRMITDMSVLAFDDRILVDLPERTVEPVRVRWLQIIFSEDVQIEALEAWRSLGLHGPTSGAVLASVLSGVAEARLNRLAEYQHVELELTGAPVVVSGSGETGRRGFILYGSAGTIDRLRRALTEHGVPSVGPDVADLLRIEAGRPAFGVDMNEETIPLEAGLEDRAISLTKGCYVGQEVIIRVLHRGQGRVARRLVGLAIDAPPGGEASVGDAVEVDGVRIGTLTSVAVSPRYGAIALGYLQRAFTEPGTEVDVVTGGAEVRGRVSRVPFGP